ncbi:hypothetical protein IL306_000457 [Fusarium sp. DS 682]|nr:hypothetical protein IL306_000457 [Fusarium sp. DS 682]
MNREKKAALAERKNVMGQMQHNLEGFNEEEQKILREGLYGDELEVTESDMMDMMGEAALGAAKEVAAETVSALPDEPAASGPQSAVQAAASEAAAEVENKSVEPESIPIEQTPAPETVAEAQAEPTQSSHEQPIASEAATQSPEQPTTPEVVAEVQSEIKPAESTHDSRLTSIEDQLSGLKDAAEAIEADIKSGKQ